MTTKDNREKPTIYSLWRLAQYPMPVYHPANGSDDSMGTSRVHDPQPSRPAHGRLWSLAGCLWTVEGRPE